MITIQQNHLEIKLKNLTLQGILNTPPRAKGIVIFVHGSGSSRLSPRNQFVANYLNRKSIGTLLFDLLTEEEEDEDSSTGMHRFNISFLAGRLGEVTRWLIKRLEDEKIHLPLGYFGASTGGGAAIVAAAHHPEWIRAVVSRGGRPDLAAKLLSHIEAPTLLIVGENDADVLRLNQEALRSIRASKDLQIVKGATHLFEEPGALEQVAHLASQWFGKYFD